MKKFSLSIFLILIMLSAFAIPICSASPFNWNNNLLSVDGFGSSNAYGTTEGQAVSSAKSNSPLQRLSKYSKKIFIPFL